jgi:cysteine desulfurase
MADEQKAHTYLDNNGTTAMCRPALDAMIRWGPARGNPSADSPFARKAREMVDHTTASVLRHCGTDAARHTVIYTSGGSEANTMILRMAATAFAHHKKIVPHIIVSAVEHGSIVGTCNQMVDLGLITQTVLQPNIEGVILPAAVQAAVDAAGGAAKVALLSVQSINNETGAIMDITAIGRIAHASKIPFHTDAVQSFGKYRYDVTANNIDAMSVSLHKFHGSMGCGMLILSNELIEGYGLKKFAVLSGSQQHGMRGGTENVPGIATIAPALAFAHNDRDAKNLRMHALKMRILEGLDGANIPRGQYKRYVVDPAGAARPNEYVILGPPLRYAAANTLLIAFPKNVRAEAVPFCNTNLKKDLEAAGFVVSIGSACATSHPKASHVLFAMRAPPAIRRSVIRISVGDDNTQQEIDAFTAALIRCVKTQWDA